jgi:hypothetical protein
MITRRQFLQFAAVAGVRLPALRSSEGKPDQNTKFSVNIVVYAMA